MNTAFVLIVMFTAWPSKIDVHPFVATQRFETEEACLAAKKFVHGKHPGALSECIPDGKDAKNAPAPASKP